MNVCACVCTSVQVPAEARGGNSFAGAGVTSGREPPDVGESNPSARECRVLLAIQPPCVGSVLWAGVGWGDETVFFHFFFSFLPFFLQVL